MTTPRPGGSYIVDRKAGTYTRVTEKPAASAKPAKAKAPAKPTRLPQSRH